MSSSAMKEMPASKLDIDFLPTAAANDKAIINRLVEIVNAVYAETEGDLMVDNYERTNAEEIGGYVAAGELVKASLPGVTDLSPSSIVGCIRVQRQSDTHGGLGAMAIVPEHRGGGSGRDMVRFAEAHCRSQGLKVMQLELLFPKEFEHPFKQRLAGWYGRMGYELVRLGDFMEDYPRSAKQLKVDVEYRVFEKKLV